MLDSHWAGARGKVMKGALTLFAQDAHTKLLLYTQADIQRAETDDQILAFMDFWPKVWRGVKPTLVFDSRFTTYANLSKLNEDGIKFITLRRRGSRLLKSVQGIKQWKRIHIPHGKRKYPNPLVHETTVHLRGYEGSLRQVIMKNNGRESPTFLVSNDTDLAVDMLVGNYARRWPGGEQHCRGRELFQSQCPLFTHSAQGPLRCVDDHGCRYALYHVGAKAPGF